MKIQRCNYLEENQMAIIKNMDTLIHNITSNELKEKNIKITKLQQELQRKDNNWNELKEFLEKNYKETQDIWYVKIINKMKELENDGSDK